MNFASSPIFQTIAHVAAIADRQHGRKYTEKLYEVRKKMEAEENSPEPDDLVLHNLRAELERLCVLINADFAPGGPSGANQAS